jgi:hypothetical protein
MRAIVREFPNHVSILAIGGIEILNSGEGCLRNVRVISAKQVAVVVNDVHAVIKLPEFQFFLPVARSPVAKKLFLYFSSRSRCDWDFVLASRERQTAKTNQYTDVYGRDVQ